MKTILKRGSSVVVAYLVVLGWTMSCVLGAASTDGLCNDACSHWASCDDAGTGYTWSYDDCYMDCKAEGDWDESYVDCVLGARLCSEVEAC